MSRRTHKRIKKIMKWVVGTVVLVVLSFVAYQISTCLKSQQQ